MIGEPSLEVRNGRDQRDRPLTGLALERELVPVAVVGDVAIAEVCLDVLSESKELVSIATRSVTQDLRTAITLVTAAVKASLETAEHNLDLLDGPARDRLADRVGDAADWATVLTDSSQGSGK
ncbi:MAG: hypothetical protein ACI9EZ_000460 [Halobacteriales archaeon]|jgi:hypothetical protein